MLAILGIILGIAGIILATQRGAEAAPPELYIPTADEISNVGNLAKLDAYYELLNELHISGHISYDTYMELYDVYETRFYELVEGV